MKWELLIIFILMASISKADIIDDTVQELIADTIRGPLKKIGAREEAIQGTARGIAATSAVTTVKTATRKVKKKVESKTYKVINNTTGLSKRQIATVLAVGMSASRGVVGTKGIKYKIRPIEDLDIRPDVIYNFRDESVSTTLNLKWSW